MKLMICEVQNRYRVAMEEGLKEKNYRMTELASSGGFRKKGSTIFLIGISETDIENLKETMKDICVSVEEKKGWKKEGGSRFKSFLIDAKDSMPFLQQQNRK